MSGAQKQIHIWQVCVICLVLVVYSVGIDVLIEQGSVEGGAKNTFFDALIPDFLLYKSYSSFFLSLAFALLIWVLVSQTVEAVSKREQDETHQAFLQNIDDSYQVFLSNIEGTYNEKVDDISQRVFKGVFGVGFPDEYVDEVVRNVFTWKIYRTAYKAIYRLQNASGTSDGIVLNVYIRYSAINYGKAVQTLKPNLHFSAFKTDNFINNTKVISMKFDGDELVDDDFKKSFEESLNDKSNTDVIAHTKEVDLHPDQEAMMEIKYEIYKEKNDNEIHQVTLPTSGFDVELKNETSFNYELGINRIHRKEFTEIDCGAEQEKRWELNTPTLPRQGYIVYWEIPPE